MRTGIIGLDDTDEMFKMLTERRLRDIVMIPRRVQMREVLKERKTQALDCTVEISHLS